jgi:hypothetical protein
MSLVASLTLFTLLVWIGAARAQAANPWLVVSDVHYDPTGSAQEPSRYGTDTNPALLNEAIAAMRREDPNPPVVILSGDLLAHAFKRNTAGPTMAELARRFGRAFPHAQFVLALGNNDSDCGDYRLRPGDSFMRDVAAAWAPLVDRNGAAPSFRGDFARRGSYVARLPVTGLRVVVVDDVVWSWRYRECGNSATSPSADQLRWLDRTLRDTPHGLHNWLVLHIPPGVDVQSTRLVHGVTIVPFLTPGANDRLTRAIDDPSNRVAFVIAGHSHKFAFRFSDATVPARNVLILLVPSISPIFRNNPSFLTMQVDASGSVRDVKETSFVRDTPVTTFDSRTDYGVRSFDARSMLEVQKKMAGDPALQARFERAYDGAARKPEVHPADFRAYWCAATQLEPEAYRACAGHSVGGRSIARIIDGVAVVLVVSGILIILRRRSQRGGVGPRTTRSTNPDRDATP